jgi:hypothetical protein
MRFMPIIPKSARPFWFFYATPVFFFFCSWDPLVFLYFEVSKVSNWFFFCHCCLIYDWFSSMFMHTATQMKILLQKFALNLVIKKKGRGSFIQIGSFCFGWAVLIVCVFHVCTIFFLRSIYTDLLCIALNTLCDEFFWNVYQCTKFWNLNQEITCPLLFNFKIYIICAIILYS